MAQGFKMMGPDEYALAVTMQYLKEHGYSAALSTLERESGVLFLDEKLAQGSELLQMVYERIEARLSASLEEEEGGQGGRLRRLEEQLLQGGGNDYPRELAAMVALPANGICLACWPGARRAVVGLGDGSLRVCSYDGDALGSVTASSSGVLSVAIQPAASDNGQLRSLVAVGCMDGSVCLVDTATPTAPVLCGSAQPHNKYVVALKWSPDGHYLVTASWDQSLTVMRVDSGTSGIGSAAEPSMQVVHREQCGAQVLAVEFLRAGAGRSFLVAVRGTNYLRQYIIVKGSGGNSSKLQGSGGSTSKLKGSGGSCSSSSSSQQDADGQVAVELERRINMNAVGDDYVSFTACHLAVSPGAGGFLLVSADNGRIIMFELEGWTQVRNFYGLSTEQFHQFAAAWHAGGHYVLAAAAHGWVYVFAVSSAKVVAKFKAHDKNVRGLAYDPASNALLTCSFDRSLKVFK